MQAPKLMQTLKSLTLALLLVSGVSYAASTWSGPWTDIPGTPGSKNVDAPINVGPLSQSKLGDFIVQGLPPANQGVISAPIFTGTYGTFKLVGVGTQNFPNALKVNVNGDVGANHYCDQNGNNCITPGSGGGGGTTVDDLTTSGTACAKFCGRITEWFLVSSPDNNYTFYKDYIAIAKDGTYWRCDSGSNLCTTMEGVGTRHDYQVDGAYYQYVPFTIQQQFSFHNIPLTTSYSTGPALTQAEVNTYRPGTRDITGYVSPFFPTTEGVIFRYSGKDPGILFWQPKGSQIPVGMKCQTYGSYTGQQYFGGPQTTITGWHKVPCPVLW